ncbi:MAG: 16S rRNA processing protein RimM [Sphingobacteriales bacterium]|jgi:16S rRNA processing protein RimM|nr:16S rRNA processing protein RimM [Sphingobacteriales bacterium]
MTQSSKYFSIGRLAGTHGLKGDLVLKHALGEKNDFQGLKKIFIKAEEADCFPWFIEKARVKNNDETYLKLEGINSKEEAQRLVQKEVWVIEKDFKKHVGENSIISLLGFTLFEGKNELGVIEEVIEQPHQILCRTTIEDKEVYIPLHEETLIEIIQKNKTVSVKLPQGLLDIYLK